MKETDSTKEQEQAMAYVLEELDAEARAAFEARLEADTELRATVRELREALFGPARQLEHARLPETVWAGIAAKTVEAEPAAGARVRRIRWAPIWAAAAVVLLGLNLWTLGQLMKEKAGGETGDLTDGRPAEHAGTVADSADEGTAGQMRGYEARIERLETEVALEKSRLRQAREELERSRANEETLAESSQRWQQQYERVAARLRPFFENRDGLGRFTVIELMDGGAHARQQPHRGFADLAGRFLMDGASIAGANPGAFVGPVVEGAGVQSPTGVRPESDLPVVGSGEGELVAGGAEPGAVPEGEREGSEVGNEDLSSGEPAGFTVWRDDEQKGFLDVYNVPPPAEGREAYLWVRASELEPYLPVGAVPDLQDGAGSFFYSVDQPDFTPSEILITEEPSGSAGDNPGGSVLLRGP